MSKRVVLAMSGGVDSSAAAVLLQQQGYEVIGLFMRSGVAEPVESTVGRTSLGADLPILNPKAHKQGCCSAWDAADARRVADSLDIPFHALNFQDAFSRIKDYFADEYLAGRTPNPCVMCNNWLKFGKLWDFAQQVGADYIASGHYARIVNGQSSVVSGSVDQPTSTTDNGQRTTDTPRPALTRGLDLSKDQAYVLFGIKRRAMWSIRRATSSGITRAISNSQSASAKGSASRSERRDTWSVSNRRLGESSSARARI